MSTDTDSSDESIRQAEEVHENLVQENPSLHIQMNENEPELKPHYIHSLWTQLTKIVGINISDANLSQPITQLEDCQAFLTIVTAFSQPESYLNFAAGSILRHLLILYP